MCSMIHTGVGLNGIEIKSLEQIVLPKKIARYNLQQEQGVKGVLVLHNTQDMTRSTKGV